MRRIGNLWDKFISDENLELAKINSQKDKKKQFGVIRFNTKNPELKMRQLKESLENGTYRTGKYISKKIYEPKERVIYKLPYYPDRIVHHAILNVLIPYFERWFVSESFACIVGKGQLKASQLCSKFVRKNKFCLKCDVHHFFPSINQKKLSEMLHSKIKDERFMRVVDNVIFSFDGETNIPIGNYTSQWFANYYLTALDYFIKHELRCECYVRYCDDFILFSNDKAYLHECKRRIEKFLKEELFLEFSKAEVFSTKQGVDFCGYRSFGTFVLVRKSTVKRHKKKIRIINETKESPDFDVKHGLGVVASVHGTFCHANTHRLREKLDFDNLLDEMKERNRKSA